MDKKTNPNWHKLLNQSTLYEQLFLLDKDLATETKNGRCQNCQGRLHSANYQRKPRGSPAELAEQIAIRFSFCCEMQGCRKRHTPPSMRFLSKRVYFGAVVILVCIFKAGVNAQRLSKLQQILGSNISKETVKRWHDWWQNDFIQSKFWQSEKGRFATPIEEEKIPHSLLERFKPNNPKEQLILMLRFICPLTTTTPLISR